MRRWVILALAIAAVAAGFEGVEYVTIKRPLALALRQDSRNDGFSLKAGLRWHADPHTLVLNLRSVNTASAADLARALFESAQVFHGRDRAFDKVLLASEGRVVFWIDGKTFADIGEQRANGENPLYMARKLASKLVSPNGRPAYAQRTGGVIAVVGMEMKDLTDAMSAWAGQTNE